MAAGSYSNDFESKFELKRKRRNDDESMNEPELIFAKRRNLTQLPIRPQSRPSISVTPAYNSFGPGTLTPDSIPEEDDIRSNSEHVQQLHNATYRPHSNSNTSSEGSLRVNVDSNGESSTDMEMDLYSPRQATWAARGRIGRARSNDLMSPVRSTPSLNLLSPNHNSFAHDRLPTPVASSFPSRSPFESSFAASRQMRSCLTQTTLSPMVDAESWTPQMQRPPSPAPELDTPFDEDAMMVGMDDTHSSMMSTSFSSLSVHSQDTLVDVPAMDSSPIKNWSSQTSPSPSRGHGLGLDGAGGAMRPDGLRMSTITHEQRDIGAHHNRQQSNGRTARLHMGFRADCEKCVARVPGHYSHILWT